MRRAGRFALTLLVTTAWTSTAWAQDPDIPPPSRYLVDENGVDVARGTMMGTRTDLAIGADGRAGLAFMRRFGYVESGHNFDFGLFNDSGQVRASTGLSSIPFNQSGSTYTAADGSGATLSKSGTTYTLTLSDGTVVTYNYVTTDHTDFNRFSRATSIAYPSGETVTLTWIDITWCTNTQDACAGGTWLTGVRLQAVSSSMGYQLHLNYGRADIVLPTQAATWRRLDGVTAINTTVESCSPSAHSCTLTNSWSGIAYSGNNVTDSAGRTSVYAQSSLSYEIRRPGATSASATYSVTPAYGSYPVTQVVRDGMTWSYNYSVSGTTATMVVTLPGSPTRSRTIVSDLNVGLPTSVTNEVNQTTSYTYDTSGRLTRATAPEGNYVEYSYDSRGNVTQAQAVAKSGTGLPAMIATASYPSTCGNPATCNQPETTTDERGNVTDYTYDSTHGGVLTATLPAASGGAARPQTRYTYSGLTQPGGGTVYRVTQVSQCQTLSSCTDQADEARTTIAYGQANLQPSSVTVASGNGALSATTAIGYDHIARPITVDGPLSGTADTVRTRYNLPGQVIGTIGPDPDGGGSLNHRAERITYNSSSGLATSMEAGTVASQSDADWAGFAPAQRVEQDYDANARPTVQRSMSGTTTYSLTQTSYDNAGRVQCVAQRMNPAEFGASSLPADACTLDTEGTGGNAFGPDRIARRYYDAAGRVEQVRTAYAVTGQEAIEAAMTYTANGQVETLTDAEGNKTTYEYDGHDRLSRTYMPSASQGAGTSSTTDYEELTYLTVSSGTRATPLVASRRLRDGTSIAFAYDHLGRLTEFNRPNSERSQSYAYDLLGRITDADQINAWIDYDWDALGRLESHTDGGFGTTSFQYDAAGRRTRMTWPDSFYVDYDYDTASNLSAIRENGASSGTGVLATYTYDSLGRRTGLTRGNGATTSWSYDGVSRLSQIVQNPSGTTYDLTLDYGYSPAGQIVTTTRSNDAYAWGGHYQVDRGYTANGLNQYSQIGTSITPTYDARGNVASAGGTTYSYDSTNRLVATPDVVLPTDPAGRLFAIGTTAGYTYWLNSGDQIIGEYSSSGAVLRRYVHGPGIDEPLVWYEGSGTSDRRYHHADERGSVIALSNASGNVTNVNAYDEYGIPASGNAGRFQYTGLPWLPELGMQYSRNRIYSPTLGRFMQTDPIGMAGGTNLYGYVLNDPVNFVDPFGLGPNDITVTARDWANKLANLIAMLNRMDLQQQLNRPNQTNYEQDEEIQEQNVVVTGRRTQRPPPSRRPPPFQPLPAQFVGRDGFPIGRPRREESRQRRRDFCGTGGLGGLVPDSIGGVYYGYDCASHDNCYASSTDRSVCDERLKQGIWTTCTTNNGWLCGSISRAYYDAVRSFGRFPYIIGGGSGSPD